MEKLAEDTLVFHQLHKRVWPSTQRESLFCSHLCTLPSAPRPENMVGQTWMVCNFSTDHDNVPPNSKLIRITLHVGMVCQTITDTPVEVGQEADLRRDNVSCRIIYAANGEYPHSVNRNTSISHCWGVYVVKLVNLSAGRSRESFVSSTLPEHVKCHSIYCQVHFKYEWSREQICSRFRQSPDCRVLWPCT